MAGMIPMCPWLFVYMVAGREGERDIQEHPLPGMGGTERTGLQGDWPTSKPFCIHRLNSHIFSLIVKELQKREREGKYKIGCILYLMG